MPPRRDIMIVSYYRGMFINDNSKGADIIEIRKANFSFFFTFLAIQEVKRRVEKTCNLWYLIDLRIFRQFNNFQKKRVQYEKKDLNMSKNVEDEIYECPLSKEARGHWPWNLGLQSPSLIYLEILNMHLCEPLNFASQLLQPDLTDFVNPNSFFHRTLFRYEFLQKSA